MRSLARLCTRLGRASGSSWCVVGSSGITCAVRHKYYVYRRSGQRPWVQLFACDRIDDCRRFLLDQF